MGDAEGANVIVSEAVGLIRSIEPAAAIIERMVAEAEARIRATARNFT
jgi:hypothetical protein